MPNIELRKIDFKDVEDYINWFTVDTEWMLWDAPWETSFMDVDVIREKYHEYVTKVQQQPTYIIPNRFEIYLKSENRHIGWVSRYKIDDDYTYNTAGKKCAIGIDIPKKMYRGQGYGKEALMQFIVYLYEKKIHPIYIQTWSGNYRMIELAKWIGFKEVKRISQSREVRGHLYDALTFEIKASTIQELYDFLK